MRMRVPAATTSPSMDTRIGEPSAAASSTASVTQVRTVRRSEALRRVTAVACEQQPQPTSAAVHEDVLRSAVAQHMDQRHEEGWPLTNLLLESFPRADEVHIDPGA